MVRNKATKMFTKTATSEHPGIFFYINRKRRRGEEPQKKSAKEWMQIKKSIKIAKSKSKSRRQGSSAK